MKITALAAATLVCSAFAASAQTTVPATADADGASFPACQSQQDLQQVINSDGKLMPSGCRELTIIPVKSGDGRLCVIDFSKAGDGVLQSLRDAAMPSQWWVRCDSLAPAGN